MDAREQFLSHSKTVLDAASMVLSEADTRVYLIDPVLRLLGYTSFKDIRREVPVKESGEYLDYELLIDGKPWAIVEAKSNRATISPRVAAQCVQYASVLGIRWCAVTNGQVWAVYDAYGKGDLAEKKLAEVRIDDDPQSVVDAWAVLSLMSRDRVAASMGFETLIVDRILTEELSNPTSSAIRALRASVKERLNEAVSPSDIVAAIRRLASQGALGVRPTLAEPEFSAEAAVPAIPSPVDATPIEAEEKGHKVRLSQLLRAGLVAPGEQISATGREGTVTGVLLKSAEIEIDGKNYKNLAEASRAEASRAVGVRIVSSGPAWEVWSRANGETMMAVRERFVTNGAAPE